MHHGHRFWQKKLNRTNKSRIGLLKGMAVDLIKHEQIETTYAKAKFISHEVERVYNLNTACKCRETGERRRYTFTPPCVGVK
jgi:ribosomal protein L17